MRSQSFCLNVGRYGCLAICYIYAALDYTKDISSWNDEEKVNKEILDTLQFVFYNSNALSKDMSVTDADALFKCLSIRCKVTKYLYDKEKDQLDGYNCVNFINGMNNHWVLYKDSRLLYNSLDFSNCVENGYISDVRKIEFV